MVALSGDRLRRLGVGGKVWRLQPHFTLTNLAPVLLPLGDEQGVELYYNVAVTPWCHVTPDLQVLNPFRQRVDTSLLVGVRAKIDF